MARRGRGAVRRLAVARLISTLGSSAATIAVAYVLFQRTHSAYWLSALFLLTFGLTSALSPVSGALADRMERRTIMVASDLAGAFFFVLLMFAHAPAALLSVATAASLAAVPFGPASAAAIPNLAPQDDLRWANSLVSTTGWVGRLAGYGIGGALLASTSASAVYIVNAVSFVGSACLVLSIRSRFEEERNLEEPRPRAREGFAFIFSDRGLTGILVGWAFMYFAINITTVANPPLAQAFGVGSVGYGWLEAMFAGGAVLGAIGGRWLSPRLEVPTLIFDAIIVAAASFFVALTGSFALVLVVVLVSASFDSLASVAGYSYIQERTPDSMRGRVFGALTTSFTVGNTVAFLVAGPLMTAVGPRGIYGSGGVVSLIALLVLVFAFSGHRRSSRSTADGISHEAG